MFPAAAAHIHHQIFLLWTQNPQKCKSDATEMGPCLVPPSGSLQFNEIVGLSRGSIRCWCPGTWAHVQRTPLAIKPNQDHLSMMSTSRRCRPCLFTSALSKTNTAMGFGNEKYKYNDHSQSEAHYLFLKIPRRQISTFSSLK